MASLSYDIWPFICHAPKLTQLRVYQSGFRNMELSDFVKMNEQRKSCDLYRRRTLFKIEMVGKIELQPNRVEKNRIL